MPKVAIYTKYGGFPSYRPLRCEHEGHCENRDCPTLIAAIEADPDSWVGVKVFHVPDDADWYVDEYDGWETIREGRTWPPRYNKDGVQ